MARFNMMVNGYRRQTAALPTVSSRRARAGWQGNRGRFSVSTTNTIGYRFPFWVSPLARVKFPSPKISSGFCVSGTGCNPVCLFNH